MKKILLSLVLVLLHVFVCAQAINPKLDKSFQLLLQKKSAYHKQTNGAYDGYRIKIHFGPDKEKARESKTKFMNDFPSINAYEEYQQPNFVIVVGDFRTRLEAYEGLKKIESSFPGAFIIKDKIRPTLFGSGS